MFSLNASGRTGTTRCEEISTMLVAEARESLTGRNSRNDRNSWLLGVVFGQLVEQDHIEQ
jgi:hypothetical protein